MIKSYEGYNPEVDEDAYISESADVIGKVVLKSKSSIWYHTVLRGDLEPIYVGERSNVQDNSTLHTSAGNPVKIGNGVTIGHNVILHGCEIKDNSLIGMGAIVLDGAIIESDVLLGAGSLVPPGKVIPSGSLALGSPAKVIRELTEEEKKHIRENAKEYVDFSEKHAGKSVK
ncbi:MAG: gamma carbonic anhydrase family protein [Tissierellales bacterium]|nr:gamma carbonic anhydrase family protein [Tissierellales bacterium]